MAKCACGKRDIPQKKADWQRAQALKGSHQDKPHSGCGCRAGRSGAGRTDAPQAVHLERPESEQGCAGVAAQGGLGLRAASAVPGARPAPQSGGRRMLGLRGT